MQKHCQESTFVNFYFEIFDGLRSGDVFFFLFFHKFSFMNMGAAAPYSVIEESSCRKPHTNTPNWICGSSIWFKPHA